MKIGAALLCAGLSKRMGERDKLEIAVGGVEMYRHCANLVSGLPFYRRIAVVSQNGVRPQGCEHIVNEAPERGIASSVSLAVRALGDCDAIMFFVCDQPNLRLETARKLIERFQARGKITVPCANGRRGNPCVFPKRFFDELAQLVGDVGGRAVIKRHEDEVELAEVDERELFDIDTAEDLDENEKIVRGDSV